jgi:hypothetical protein
VLPKVATFTDSADIVLEVVTFCLHNVNKIATIYFLICRLSEDVERSGTYRYEFELDCYHNLHSPIIQRIWIFKRVDARLESTRWYIPQGINFSKPAQPLQSISYHVVGIRLGFLQIEKLKF